MPFSVRRVSQAKLILEIVYHGSYYGFFFFSKRWNKNIPGYRITVRPARPLSKTPIGSISSRQDPPKHVRKQRADTLMVATSWCRLAQDPTTHHNEIVLRSQISECSATMKRCCGVAFTLQHWRPYFWSKRYKWIADHATLTRIYITCKTRPTY